jgi:hypothetical protein
LLPTVLTTTAQYQWDSHGLSIHQQNHTAKSATPFATPPIVNPFATWFIYVLVCCEDSPHLQEVHAHAPSIGQMPLVSKLMVQQAHNTLSNTGKQLPNSLALWYFIDTPHHEYMNSSCKNARHRGYKENATRKEQQPRLEGNQTAPAPLREMNKLPVFAVSKFYYEVHYLPNATSEEPMLSSGSDFKPSFNDCGTPLLLLA